MKLILLLLLSASAGFYSIAQTSVIYQKSHHGNMASLSSSKDRYGNPPVDYNLPEIPVMTYDTIELINEGCIIQKGYYTISGERVNDTICDEQIRLYPDQFEKDIKEYYGENIVLIGFDDESNIQIKNNPYFNKRKKSGGPFWLLLPMLLIDLGAYIFQPKLHWKN